MIDGPGSVSFIVAIVLGMAFAASGSCARSSRTAADHDAASRVDGDAPLRLDVGGDPPSPGPVLDLRDAAPEFPTDDPPSNGGTITFQSIGAAGWFPSRRDPATGPCDAYQSSTCCLARQTLASDALTPWDEDLILTLRGPMQVQRFAVYQPDTSQPAQWAQVSTWDGQSPGSARNLAFDGNGTDKNGFAGSVGTECLVNLSTSDLFACGAGSSPYCPTPGAGKQMHRGWTGSKLFVLLAGMPHAERVPGACSTGTGGNWYDAPWIGLSVGELVRAGQFVSCQCYAKDQTKSYLADGCGQFNVFEVVNDNNQYKNLEVFSTNMIGYGGYVGEGPCGPKCDVAALGGDVDLIDKTNVREAAQGAVSTPTRGPGAAFRRPSTGLRYFVILLDVPSRTIQLAMIHPLRVPATLSPLLPGLPATIDPAIVDGLRALRLPR
jgi:hypothetical protein